MSITPESASKVFTLIHKEKGNDLIINILSYVGICGNDLTRALVRKFIEFLLNNRASNVQLLPTISAIYIAIIDLFVQFDYDTFIREICRLVNTENKWHVHNMVLRDYYDKMVVRFLCELTSPRRIKMPERTGALGLGSIKIPFNNLLNLRVEKKHIKCVEKKVRYIVHDLYSKFDVNDDSDDESKY